MTDYWINFYENDGSNPKAPVMKIGVKHKTNGTNTFYPVWRNDKGKLYVGKPDDGSKSAAAKPAPSYTPSAHSRAKANGYQPQPNDDEIPF
jgi:hypothetical protein